MALEPIFVYGSGGHAKVVAEVLEQQACYSIAFFADDAPGRVGTLVHGYLVISRDALLQAIRRGEVRRGIVAIGNNGDRMRVADQLCREKITFITAIHPHSCVSNRATLGPGTVLMAGAVVNSGVRLGEHVIVNTHASVDHDCVIADGAHIAPGAVLCGGVTVGAGTWIGAGATVIEGITIGNGVLVAAGSTVVRDVPAGITVFGTPARPRQRA